MADFAVRAEMRAELRDKQLGASEMEERRTLEAREWSKMAFVLSCEVGRHADDTRTSYCKTNMIDSMIGRVSILSCHDAALQIHDDFRLPLCSYAKRA